MEQIEEIGRYGFRWVRDRLQEMVEPCPDKMLGCASDGHTVLSYLESARGYQNERSIMNGNRRRVLYRLPTPDG